MIRNSHCFLCGIELTPVDNKLIARLAPDAQEHPPSTECLVTYTDAWGVAIELVDEPEPDIPSPAEEGIMLQRFPTVDETLAEFFARYDLPRLGGQSSGRGWSSFALYQRCPYAWRRRYVDRVQPALWTEPESLAIGSIVHVFMALHYAAMIDGHPYGAIPPVEAFEFMRARANPEFVNEGWRLFTGYELYYRHEEIMPLAVEHDLRDPRTGESTRYDLIAYFPNDAPGRLAGTYIVEHKTASRFDYATLNGWQNDGECLGEVALWKRLGLDHRFGELRGLIVNIVGKQPKEQKFHRTIVAPSTWQIDQHLQDLKRWESLIQLNRATGVFPRARGGCVHRYGMCEHWDHCLNGENI